MMILDSGLLFGPPCTYFMYLGLCLKQKWLCVKLHWQYISHFQAFSYGFLILVIYGVHSWSHNFCPQFCPMLL